MQRSEFPDSTYTRTWSNSRGEVRFFTRPDGSRLRYYTAGTGPPLVLMHTVRGQLDYFQRVIPLLWDHYTVYAVDLPGMGWSDIVPGARYEEPQLRSAVVEFVSGLNLHGVTLAGESLGGALALLSLLRLAAASPASAAPPTRRSILIHTISLRTTVGGRNAPPQPYPPFRSPIRAMRSKAASGAPRC